MFCEDLREAGILRRRSRWFSVHEAIAGDWLGQRVLWKGPLATEPLGSTSIAVQKETDDRGALAAFVRLAAPSTGLEDLRRFVATYGWLPIGEPREETLIAVASGGERWKPSPDDREQRPVSEDDLVRWLRPVPDHMDFDTRVHPLCVYRLYASTADYILRVVKALRSYETRRPECNWERVAREYGVPAARDCADRAMRLVGSFQQEAANNVARFEAPARRSLHMDVWRMRYAVGWWFRAARLQLEPTFTRTNTLQLDPAPGNLWGVLALQLAEQFRSGRYAYCRGCARYYPLVPSAGRKGGRPALLCRDCYSPAEGRRVAARIVYKKKKHGAD